MSKRKNCSRREKKNKNRREVDVLFSKKKKKKTDPITLITLSLPTNPEHVTLTGLVADVTKLGEDQIAVWVGSPSKWPISCILSSYTTEEPPFVNSKTQSDLKT